MYEMVANQAARRVRSCVLAVIPGDVIESAVRQCDLTLRSGNSRPLEERIRDMAGKFQEEFGVTEDQLRAYIGKNVDAFSENDVVRLAKVYRSLKDGVIGSEYFLQRMTEAPEGSAKEAAAPTDAPKTEAKEKAKAVSLDDL